MKYNAAKAAAFAIIIGTPIATLAAGKAPLAEGTDLSAFRGIETIQVSDGELKEVFGDGRGRGARNVNVRGLGARNSKPLSPLGAGNSKPLPPLGAGNKGKRVRKAPASS
uniref:Uncharacterized protein n=1 Tax=Candidatus Kentrum sp. FW TaxID=2126338 RepID=A0A450TA81_9GAMM|nr:MAG: hypothetical protein BECKFW1821C_GA0114237_100445 [Candidatus Kentron sp. FW]